MLQFVAFLLGVLYEVAEGRLAGNFGGVFGVGVVELALQPVRGTVVQPHFHPGNVEGTFLLLLAQVVDETAVSGDVVKILYNKIFQVVHLFDFIVSKLNMENILLNPSS